MQIGSRPLSTLYRCPDARVLLMSGSKADIVAMLVFSKDRTMAILENWTLVMLSILLQTQSRDSASEVATWHSRCVWPLLPEREGFSGSEGRTRKQCWLPSVALYYSLGGRDTLLLRLPSNFRLKSQKLKS